MGHFEETAILADIHKLFNEWLGNNESVTILEGAEDESPLLVVMYQGKFYSIGVMELNMAYVRLMHRG